jgi:uncharacterized protein DUF6644
MLLSLALWIQATDFFTYLRGSKYSYPVVLSLHMVALALFGGMILITNMRLMGWRMGGVAIPDVIDQLRLPKRLGFTLAAVCGFLLLCSKAEEYYYNVFFRTKLLLLALVVAHALIFRRRVYYNSAPHPGAARTAGWLSLLLWIAILCAGRGIGYIEPPFGIHA